MSWNDVAHHFQGDPNDLIEVNYYDMNENSWAKLFSWLQGRVIHLTTQDDQELPSKIDISKFLSGELSYIAETKCTNGKVLSLSIIDEDTLTIDIEKKECQNSDQYEIFIFAICEIASVMNSKNYMVSPEFKKDEAFFINGIEKQN